ncbi:type IV fimbrial biogenesis protein FimT [Nitrosomonas aestuarii]|uniref:Type II secretion system protein H n=1 Tax=Nitrosomonas aestuarii TaxID=52441 RepID=A0A1I4F6P7_9PROT|nr:GspH/FimT family pseudopilin [Nitrosomonas aestuarii]SFL13662.1 type IV fimbrial biogenesis protein FimT [Nitrosomonas aestuarii]
MIWFFFNKNRGVTLIELLVVLSVLGILLSIGVPSFSQFTTNNRLNSYINSMYSNFALARSEAIKRNRRVVMCKSSDGANCNNSGGWDQGWIVFVDLDNNGTIGGGEEIVLTMLPLQAGYNFTGNGNVDNYISFDVQGRTKLTSGAIQAGTFTLCPAAPAVDGLGRQLILSGSGRSRVEKITSCS